MTNPSVPERFSQKALLVYSRAVGGEHSWRSPRSIVFLFLVPACLYLFAFSILTYPMIGKFSTHFFTDSRDGLQNVWNLWWVDHALTRLGQSPWETDLLHHPFGISLIAHTLNPFNGFLSVPLQRLLTLTQTFNVIVLFAFVSGGVTAFWLGFRLLRSYWGAIVVGGLFTFSSYHYFSLQRGHLQTLSFEWVPLFVLCFLRLLDEPSVKKGLAAAFALFLVILCDFYFFFFCVLAGALMTLWQAGHLRDPWFWLRREHGLPILVFVMSAVATCAPLVIMLLAQNHSDPLLGAHPPDRYSMDFLGAFFPGGNWRFAGMAHGFLAEMQIGRFKGGLGIALVSLTVYAWIQRRSVRLLRPGLWLLLTGFFWALSLGPELHVAGRSLDSVPMPYSLLAKVFPPLEMGGVPERMMLIPVLCTAILASAGLEKLVHGGRWGLAAACACLALLVIEHLPGRFPVTRLETPEYVRVLRSLPDGAGVIDTKTELAPALYFQTIHEKPVVMGYVSRIPQSVYHRGRILAHHFKTGDFLRVRCQYNVRYWVADAEGKEPNAYMAHDIRLHVGDVRRLADEKRPHMKQIFRGDEAEIFEIAPDADC